MPKKKKKQIKGPKRPGYARPLPLELRELRDEQIRGPEIAKKKLRGPNSVNA